MCALARLVRAGVDFPSSYTTVGCYNDNATNRALPIDSVPGSLTGMTNRVCANTYARPNGYRVFGTQGGSRCYAGNDLVRAKVSYQASDRRQAAENALGVCVWGMQSVLLAARPSLARCLMQH